MGRRTEEIISRLREHLDARHVEIQDDSAAHRGHVDAAGGGGHYTITVVSQRFAGLDRLARHRAIHRALGDMFPEQIHALSAMALTPPEWESRKTRESAEEEQ